MKKKSNSLQGLENLLPQLSQQRGWEEQLDLHSIFVRWHELVDSEIADHCQPLKIVKKVLWCEVENSAWLQQLQFQTVLLLDILNKSLRFSRLKGLRFCVAEKERRKEEKKELTLRYVQPPAEDVAAFEHQAESISDKDSRDALVRFWYLSQACRKE
jgi:predicted nucleic acid-binding Zn ribbon protein